MTTIHVVLIVLSFLCFALSAWMHASPYWNRLVSLGLAALAASLII